MSRENQIEQMAKDLCDYYRTGICYHDGKPCDLKCVEYTNAQYLYEKGYRKIHDDNAIQCVCYALGCQAAEKIKAEVAAEICAEIGERFKSLLKMLPADGTLTDAKTFIEAHWEFIEHSIVYAYDAELKKKYTEGEG